MEQQIFKKYVFISDFCGTKESIKKIKENILLEKIGL
jgi:hypothetical protein